MLTISIQLSLTQIQKLPSPVSNLSAMLS
jgi:hypothetical protein